MSCVVKGASFRAHVANIQASYTATVHAFIHAHGGLQLPSVWTLRILRYDLGSMVFHGFC